MSSLESTPELYPEKVTGYPPETDAVADFAIEILGIEEQLIALETKVTEVSIGSTGFMASRRFSELERRHRKYVCRLNRMHSSVLRETLEPAGIGEYEDETEFEERAGDGEFDDYLERLERQAERIGQRLASRRNSANTRMGLTISLIAVFISTISIFSP